LKYLRQEIREFLDFSLPEGPIPFTIKEEVGEAGYSRQVIQYYGREGDTIPAYLLIPEGEGPFPAVLLYHQHNGERHIGKSEMCGLVGDPFLAFGPALAKQGIAVLAPDSICFEDRRRNVEGVEPHELDVAQHYDEMCYRLLRGDTLMRKILDDGAHAITLLREHPLIRQDQIEWQAILMAAAQFCSTWRSTSELSLAVQVGQPVRTNIEWKMNSASRCQVQFPALSPDSKLLIWSSVWLPDRF
jgi:hypothetical protein